MSNPIVAAASYTETATTGQVPTMDENTILAVNADTHIDRDGVTSEVTAAVVVDGVAVETAVFTPARAFAASAALADAARLAGGAA